MAALTDAELADLINALRDHTALGRIALGEAETIFAKLAELGYTITKPAAD